MFELRPFQFHHRCFGNPHFFRVQDSWRGTHEAVVSSCRSGAGFGSISLFLIWLISLTRPSGIWYPVSGTYLVSARIEIFSSTSPGRSHLRSTNPLIFRTRNEDSSLRRVLYVDAYGVRSTQYEHFAYPRRSPGRTIQSLHDVLRTEHVIYHI